MSGDEAHEQRGTPGERLRGFTDAQRTLIAKKLAEQLGGDAGGGKSEVAVIGVGDLDAAARQFSAQINEGKMEARGELVAMVIRAGAGGHAEQNDANAALEEGATRREKRGGSERRERPGRERRS